MSTPHSKTADLLRWAIGLGLTGLVSYFTAIGTINRELAIVKATEENHFEEVLRRLEVLQVDVRELRRAKEQ